VKQKTHNIYNKIHKMTHETLRMQMLAGVITEGEYKAIINKEIEEEEKASLNESMIGGIVGIGAINQIPPREKTDYEMAFEHFLGERYQVKPNRERDDIKDVNEEEEIEENEFQPLFKSIRDLPIVDFQRKQFDQLNDLYNAYLVKYADSKGDNGSQMSPNELNRKYGEEIRSELGVDSIRTADIATALIKAGLIKVNKGAEGEEMGEGKEVEEPNNY
jgi:hypothetical protein